VKKTIVTMLVLTLTGYATASKDISSTYISPVMYQGYDCQQIAAETVRLQTRVNQLGGRLDEANRNDKAIATAGAILFWPALFALGGTKAQEAEYANLKGQADALQVATIDKKCSTLPTQSASTESPKVAAAN
jgi:hypothetical protein